MEKIITKTIGKEKHTYIVSGETLWDVEQAAQKLSFHDVYKCGECGSNNLKLHSRKPQDKFKYLTIQCRDCKAQLNFGQTQGYPTVYYLRKRQEGDKKVLDWEKWQNNGSPN